MVNNTCIYCLLPVDADFSGKLHENCTSDYQADMDRQSEIFRLLMLDENYSISISENIDVLKISEKVRNDLNITADKDLSKLGKDTSKAFTNSFANYFYPSQVSNIDTIPKDTAISIVITIDQISQYVCSVEIENYSDQKPVNAPYMLELILQFYRIEHLQITNLGDIGFLNANFTLLTFLDNLILDNIEFILPDGFFLLNHPVTYIGLWNVSGTFVEMIISGIPEKLLEFSITSSDVSSIPDGLCNSTGLTILTITKTTISSIPFSLGRLINLRELNLNNNGIKSLPESFSSLLKLETLNLSHNQLIECSGISNLPKLRDIDLSFNFLSDLSPLCSLPSLSVLNANFNYIVHLPSNLVQLHKLSKLSVLGNTIIELPGLHLLKNLQSLDIGLDSNIDLTILSSLSSLEYLTIFSPVLHFPDFTKLSHLKQLILNIREDTIPEYIFYMSNLHFIGIIISDADPDFDSVKTIFHKNTMTLGEPYYYIDEYFLHKYESLQLNFPIQ